MFFESMMLVCFGASWPMSVWKVWKSKTSAGKSLIFLSLILIGYGCGIVHKMRTGADAVIWLYAVNAVLVAVDLALCVRYRPVRTGGCEETVR